MCRLLKVKSKKELLSEELRLLYVALTRAKEKLYLVGVVKDYEDKIKESDSFIIPHTSPDAENDHPSISTYSLPS